MSYGQFERGRAIGIIFSFIVYNQVLIGGLVEGLSSLPLRKLLIRHYLLGSIFGVTRFFTRFSGTTLLLVHPICDIAQVTDLA
jgi:hypothetical protein